MHKTTRQIWTSSSSSSSSSCFFCDFQLLISRTTPARTSPTRAVSTRSHSRNSSYPTIATRTQQQRLASCLRIFGINPHQHPQPLEASHQTRLFRSQRQVTYPSSAAPLPRGGVRSMTAKNSCTAKATSKAGGALSQADPRSQTSIPFGSEYLHRSTTRHRIAISPRVYVQDLRYLSTSTSTSVASDQEADASSSVLASTNLISKSTSFETLSPSAPSSPILDLKAAVKESTSTSDFQSLFPEIPASFAETSSRNPFTSVKSETPWRSGLMNPGSELEESLRKSVYQRDSIKTWWPLYEQAAGQWRNRSHSRSISEQSTALCRSDFMRLIGALKVSSSSPGAIDRLARLEQIFEDFHCAIVVPKSNVKVYTAFMETLHFWRMDDQIPGWIQRIKSKIRIPQSTAPVDDEILLIRESAQEQYHDLMRTLAKVNQVDAMLECLEELKADRSGRFHLTTKAYDTVLETYMKHKDTASALRIFQEMQDQGVSPQLTTFNILLRGHLENKDARATQRVLESLLLTDIRPDIYTFNLLMSGYLKLGDIELVNGFYKGLGEYGLVPNSKTYRILMKTHLRQGEVSKIVDLFCKLKDSPKAELNPGPEDYRVLIQALATYNRMPDALRVLREMTDIAKVPVTTPIYNVVLNQYARDGQVEKARRILDRIISEKLPLIDGSINPLIRAYLAQKDLDKVEEMMQLMDRYGLQPSRTTYNIMINSTRNLGNLSGAMEMYDRMLSAGVEPDVWTYNTLLDLYVAEISPAQNDIRRKGDASKVSEEQLKEYLPRIESLLQDMKVRGIKPDVVTYGKLIHQYVILRDIEQAEMLFHEMLKSGTSPNGYIFNTLMNGFTLIEEMDKALELFRRMPKYGVQPDATTFTTLIKGYANLEQMRLAQGFADSLQHQSPNIPMDQYCLNTLMQLAQRSNQPGMALDFFEMMRGRGIEPDKVTFTILLNSLSREFEDLRLRSSVAKMGDRSRGRRAAAGGDRGSMENKNVEASSAAEAIEALLEVIRQDVYPLHHSEITTVIAAYFRLGRPLAAIEFFKTSLWRKGSKLNTTSCGALFHGLLAPEYKRRFDGVALNLYSRMLSGTKEAIQAQEERERNAIEISSDNASYKAVGKDQSRQNSPPDDEISWALPQASSSRTVSRKLKVKPEDGLTNGLPILDLISIKILLQSFSNCQNWRIVLQIWQDLESVGAEKLYPFEMPLEFLGLAAQAYRTTPDRERWSGSKKDEKEKTHAEMAEKILRRLWNADHRTGVEWSVKIYGYNMFEPLSTSNVSSTSSSSLPPPLEAGMLTSPSTASTDSPSLLSSYLSENVDQASYQREVQCNERDKNKEGEDQQQHH